MVAIDPLADMALSETHKAAVRKQLAYLAAREDQPALRELARNVLAGKVDLRGAILSGRYTEPLNDSVRRFSDWYHGLSAEERAEKERQGHEFALQARREHGADQRSARRSRPPAEEYEWASRPVLRKRIPRR